MDLFQPVYRNGWETFAKKYGGEYLREHNIIRYKYRKWNVVVEVYTEENNIDVGFGVGPFSLLDSATTYTRIRSYVVNQQGLFFQARFRQFLDAFLGWFGKKRLKFKQEEFQKHVQITASDQVLGREVFLDHDLQNMLVRHTGFRLGLDPLKKSRERWAFGATGALLSFRLDRDIDDLNELEKSHFILAKMLDRLAELGVIGPERPKPRTAKNRR